MITYPQLSRAGRIGNQLWEIASTIGIATKRNTVARFPLWDYQPFFSVPESMFVENPQGTPATELVPHLDYRARAYLQDYSLFQHVESLIREFFRPSPTAEKVLAECKWFEDLERPITSMHVRRGDNVTHPLGIHPLRSMAYYRRALYELPDEGAIVVFSDDPEWCKANFEREVGCKVAVFYEGVPRPREYEDRVKYETAPVLDWIDLQLMARCDYHVISNSTYAWWGAFLSENPSPIYPSNWFGFQIRDWTDASLMFPPAWRQVYDETQGGV